MPTGIVGEDDHPEDSDYRFVVLHHPELGEFLDWDTAVAKAWEVTPPGARRAEVTLAPKGVQQLRTSDPETLGDLDLLDGVVIDNDHARRIHQIEEFRSEGTNILSIHTYCGMDRSQDQWVTYSPTRDSLYTQCPGCFLRRA